MSDKNVTNGDPILHEVSPRENSGRDTIARYQSQFRAAAYESLSLLEDDVLDRVYCDYQDDYIAQIHPFCLGVYQFQIDRLRYVWFCGCSRYGCCMKTKGSCLR